MGREMFSGGNSQFNLGSDDFHSILNTMDDNIAIIDQNHTIKWVNSSWVEFGEANGLPAGFAHVGADYLSAFSQSAKDDAQTLFALTGVRKVLCGKAPAFQYEYTCHGPDEERWFVMKIRPCFLQGAKHFLISHHDITRRVRAEHEKLHSIIDNLYGYVGFYSLDGKLLDVNQTPVEAANLDRGEVIGKPFWETYWWSHSTDEQARIRSALERAARGEVVRADYTVRLADNEFITIDAMFGPIHDEEGRIHMLMGFGVDVSERARLEAQAKESESRLKEILNITPVAIITISEKLEIIQFNKGAERIFGYTEGELIGQPLTVLMPERFRHNHDRQVAEFRESDDGWKSVV